MMATSYSLPTMQSFLNLQCEGTLTLAEKASGSETYEIFAHPGVRHTM